MKRSDIFQEIRYCWECPVCGDFNEECDEPDYEYSYVCDGCAHEEILEDVE